MLVGWYSMNYFKNKLPQLLGWFLLKKLNFSILKKRKEPRDDVFQECGILRRGGHILEVFTNFLHHF